MKKGKYAQDKGSSLLRVVGLWLWVALWGVFPAGAQERDTLSVQQCDHTFRAGQLVMPGTLVVAGTAGLFSPVSEWKVDVRDRVREYALERTAADDYIQYVPVAMAVAGDWIGAEAQHDFLDRVVLVGTSYVMMAAVVNGLKYTVVSVRPGKYDEVYLQNNPNNLTSQNAPKTFNSFPSGHAATAFMGAELVRLEYGAESPWIGVAAYAVASGTSIMRVWNEKHWFTDVLAGAGMGMLSARVGWWLLPGVSRVARNVLGLDATHGQTLTVCPTASDGHPGMTMCMSF